MWVSSLACGYPSRAEFWKVGAGRTELVEGRGLGPQLKRGSGGRVKTGGCFEGTEEEELVFLVEEKSWDR